MNKAFNKVVENNDNLVQKINEYVAAGQLEGLWQNIYEFCKLVVEAQNGVLLETTRPWLKVVEVWEDDVRGKQTRMTLIDPTLITGVSEKEDGTVKISTFEGDKTYYYLVKADFQTVVNYLEVEEEANIITLNNYR